jgi:hypothetical protein
MMRKRKKTGGTDMPSSQQNPSSSPPVDFPVEELAKYRGCWVAFSADGLRLIASGRTFAALETNLRAAGENLEEVLLEHVPDGDAISSASELS